MKRFFLTLVVLGVVGAAGMFLGPHIFPELAAHLGGTSHAERSPAHKDDKVALPPAVSIVKAAQADFTEMVTVSGSLKATV